MNALVNPDRALPVNIEAEQALLGAILSAPEALFAVQHLVTAEHFSEPLHARIYATCIEMAATGKKPSPVTLKDYIGWDQPAVGEMTVGGYVAALVANSAGEFSIDGYARSVVDLAVRRSLIGISQGIRDLAYDAAPGDSPRGQIEQAIEKLSVLAATGLKRHQRQSTAASAADAFLADLEAGKKERPISTGYRDLDRVIGGYRRGNLLMLAGRPGMAKSTVAGSTARKVAEAGHGVLFFSMEMTKDQLSARLLTEMIYRNTLPVLYEKLLNMEEIKEEDRWALKDAAKRLKTVPLIIDPQQGMTFSEMAVRARRTAESMQRRGIRLGLIIADHLGKFRLPNQGNRNIELGEVTNAAAALSKELDCCFMLLCQLNRQAEQRDNKRPQLPDLRESGHIEEDADAVIGLYREAYYLAKQKHEDGDAELKRQDKLNAVAHDLEAIVLKNRHGAEGLAKLWIHVGAAVVNDRDHRA